MMVVKASSMWPSLLTLKIRACTPMARAAVCALVPSSWLAGLSGFTSMATVSAFGTSSRSSSSRFAISGEVKNVTPVIFPPGQSSSATSPGVMGSPPIAHTIGIVVVAALAANAAGVPLNGGDCRHLTAHQVGRQCRQTFVVSISKAYSIATVLPATWPVSVRPRWNGVTMRARSLALRLLRNPTAGIVRCCATDPQRPRSRCGSKERD